MTKFRFIGVLASLGGGVLICFQVVSRTMGSEGPWQRLTLMDVVGERYFEWLGNASLGGAERIVETIVTLPLFVLLLCIGGLFFVLDYFWGRR